MEEVINGILIREVETKNIMTKSLSRNKCICGIMPKGDENDRKEELSSMDNFR